MPLLLRFSLFSHTNSIRQDMTLRNRSDSRFYICLKIHVMHPCQVCSLPSMSFAVCIQRKSARFPSSCSLPLSSIASNAASVRRSCILYHLKVVPLSVKEPIWWWKDTSGSFMVYRSEVPYSQCISSLLYVEFFKSLIIRRLNILVLEAFLFLQ